MKPLIKKCGIGIGIGILGFWSCAAVALADSSSMDSMKRIKRNPFSLPKGVHYKSDKKSTQSTLGGLLKKEPEKQVVQLPPMSLQAVILGGPRRVAVINNSNYVVGEFIFDHELIEIGRDQAVLMGKTGTLVLNVEAAPFGVKVSAP